MKRLGVVGLCVALLFSPSISTNEAFSSASSFGSLKRFYVQQMFGDVCDPGPFHDPIKSRLGRLFDLHKGLGAASGGFQRNVRGIYLGGKVADSVRGRKVIERVGESGANAVVIDLKTVYGDLFVPYEHEFVREHGLYDRYAIKSFSALADHVKSNGLYLIVRVPCFADQLLYRWRADCRLRDGNDEGVVTDGKLYWLDPSHEEVRQYLLGLLEFALEKYPQIDEVQLDYIRFPAFGEEVRTQVDLGENGRQGVITAFVAEASEVVRARHSKHLSVAVYGITVWNRAADLGVIGQNLAQLAPYVDRISGMFYSSHYESGFGGYESPADHPRWIVGRSMNALRRLVRAHPHLAITPWLQGFDWRLRSFDLDYVLQNIEGAAPYGSGYLFWNANGDYDLVVETFGRLHALPVPLDFLVR